MRLIDADNLEIKIMEMGSSELCGYTGLPAPEICDDCALEMVDAIHGQPTVDAAPVVHGHWLERVNPRWPAYSHDECSKCGWSNSQDARCYEGRERRSLKYCPNCGAKMDGGAKND